MNDKRIILISGFARSGKDTLANAIAKEMNETHHIQGRVFKFANPLKGSLQTAVQAVGLGYVDVWTEDSDLKAALRPLLVEFGKYCRSINRDVFVNKTLSDIEDAQRLSPLTHIVPIISDLRYLNEIQRVRSWAMHQKVNTKVYWAHIQRMGIGSANEEEKRSLEELRQAGTPDTGFLFLEGDVDGITQWAKDIATKICKPSEAKPLPCFINKTLAVPFTAGNHEYREDKVYQTATEYFGTEEVEKRNAQMVEDMKAMDALLGVDLEALVKRVERLEDKIDRHQNIIGSTQDRVTWLALTLERMDARLKRLEAKNEPNF